MKLMRYTVVLGNLIAGYVQQDMWFNVFTNERIIVTARADCRS